MTKKETDELYAKIKLILKLFEEYEKYCSQKNKKIKRITVSCELLRLSGFFMFFALFFYAVINIALCSDPVFIIPYLFLIFLSFVILIIVTDLSVSNTEKKEKFLCNEELAIYRKNKSAFSAFDDIQFPPDYMCSGFARAVLNELKSDKNIELEAVYLKCKYIVFDMCSDSTSAYIVKNRNFITKARNFMIPKS